MPSKKYTQAEVEAKVRELRPTATPTWITAFATWLLNTLPTFLLSLFMGVLSPKPGGELDSEQGRIVSLLVAIHEAEGPPKMKGPVTDPFVKSGADWVKAWLEANIPHALDVAETAIIDFVSAHTP